MAQWKETLEPYVKVIESVKTTTSNPTVSTGLIVGAALISDTGSATPTLITSQKEFLANFATKEISEAYMKEIDALYVGEQGSNMASTMWLNAYRLAGSTNLLISRAVNGKDVIYAKDLLSNDKNYILRDSEILKKVDSETGWKLVKDANGTNGWLFILSEVGAFGNLVDNDGPQYDYDVQTIPDLVTKLNETNKFFSPKYSFYTDAIATQAIEITSESSYADKVSVVAVLFEESYLAPGIMDKEDSRGASVGYKYMIPATKDWDPEATPLQAAIDLNESPAYAKFTAPKYYVTNLSNSSTDLKVRIRRFNHNAVTQKITSSSDESPWTVLTSVLDLYTAPGHPTETERASDFYEVAVIDPSLSSDWMLFNVGNFPARGDVTTSEINAALGRMQIKFPDDLKDLGLVYYGYPGDNEKGFKSVYSETGVTTPALPVAATVNSITKYTVGSDEMTVKGTLEASADLPTTGLSLGDVYLKANKAMFYKEVSVASSIPSEAVITPTGFIGSPITTALVSVKIGDETHQIESAVKGDTLPASLLVVGNVGKKYALCTTSQVEGEAEKWASITKIVTVSEDVEKWTSIVNAYKYDIIGEDVQVDVNAKVPNTLSLLNVTKSTILQAWDAIQEDERYIVEGATDLGCTDTLIQNYIANIANSDEGNYFYPVSTANTTNYMSIANHKSKITTHSHKEYFLSPWDYDSGTTGFLFNVSPATLYWELIASNKKNNQEFAAAFSQTNGIITPVRLAKEFTKKERQLLLTKNINTIYHDLYLERYYINDNRTDYVGDETVLGEECNARFQIRISKALKQSLLPQFRGKQSNATTWANVRDVINYWFKFTVLGYGSTIAEWNVICDASNNTDEDIRAHRLNVKVQVRFQSSAKYITVYNDAYPIGLEFEA